MTTTSTDGKHGQSQTIRSRVRLHHYAGDASLIDTGIDIRAYFHVLDQLLSSVFLPPNQLLLPTLL
jgi:hypothetical protein